ncbi:MAG: hypothetical protein H0U71_03055 [Gammaproteobacteria bacterium]|nr:hypothetical protein [Gammaproteobacteria bacterium]
MNFEPIAIIGRACLAPHALTSTQLWQNILAQKDCLTTLTESSWAIDPLIVFKDRFHLSSSDKLILRGGYISDFTKVFDPHVYNLPAEFILKLDDLFQWLLHVSREALQDAHHPLNSLSQLKAGAIFGNLFLPSTTLRRFGEIAWLLSQDDEVVSKEQKQNLENESPEAINRFSVGLPVNILSKALNLSGSSYMLDAACASTIYAIKGACDQLHNRSADLMLAGGINHSDDALLKIGFYMLQAMSPTGQIRPLHKEADGLVTSEAATAFVLKRLDDAINDHDSILGVIRGIGLSNDGSDRNLLIPSENGQINAMQQAYQYANIDPADISWVECHATGTPLGDSIEIKSMAKIFDRPISIGALKGIIGHTLTASAGTALIKLIAALQSGIKPPTPYAVENPLEILHESNFQLNSEPIIWATKNNEARLAAINAFGFGGNNAHLIVEEWQPQKKASHKNIVTHINDSKPPIAVVGIGVIASSANNKNEFIATIKKGKSTLRKSNDQTLGGQIEQLEFDIREIHFPPNDLKQTLGQQLAILKAMQEAVIDTNNFDEANASVLIGMSNDTEICLKQLSWIKPLLTQYLDFSNKDLQLIFENDKNDPAYVLGILSNIVTNRLNSQFDLKGPSYCIGAEELSGVVALDVGCEALQKYEMNTVVIGAVDMCCTPVHISAAKQVLSNNKQIPGDAAVAMVLKRLDDAIAHNNHIYAVINDDPNVSFDYEIKLNDTEESIVTQLFGHAHAASGLLHLLYAILACDGQFQLGENKIHHAKTSIEALGGTKKDIYVRSYKPMIITNRVTT